MNRRVTRHGVLATTTALAAGLVLAGCGADTDAAADPSAKPHLKIEDAFLPEPVTTALAAGFFTVTNAGGADRLTSVTSDLADEVTLHTTKDGAMKEQDSFPVPANGTLDFTRGGNHLMFEKLTHKPKPGDTVSVELHFKRSGAIKVKVPVKSATYNPENTNKTDDMDDMDDMDSHSNTENSVNTDGPDRPGSPSNAKSS